MYLIFGHASKRGVDEFYFINTSFYSIFFISHSDASGIHMQ